MVRSAGVNGLLKVTVKPFGCLLKAVGRNDQPLDGDVSEQTNDGIRRIANNNRRTAGTTQRAGFQRDSEGVYAVVAGHKCVTRDQYRGGRVGASDADRAG